MKRIGCFILFLLAILIARLIPFDLRSYRFHEPPDVDDDVPM